MQRATRPSNRRPTGCSGRPRRALPPLPEPLGLGGAFIGLSKGALIVAGGSNFDRPTWDGGEKAYHGTIYVLDLESTGAPQWRSVGRLPRPLAHGAAVAVEGGLLCMGGMNDQGAYADVFLLAWDRATGTVRIQTDFPSLPRPCSHLAATTLGNIVYVAGGRTEKDGAMIESGDFLALDLAASGETRSGKAWEHLPTWPGVPRFGCLLVTQRDGYGDRVYLFSGKSGTTYLTDAYAYNPGRAKPVERWRRLADMPRAALLAPIVACGQSHILVISGSDGHDVDRVMELKHDYELVKDILAYHTITDTWIRSGEVPQGVVATTAIDWKGRFLIPGGEIRPSIRTPRVYAATLRPTTKATFHPLDYAVLCVYLLGLVGMGLYFSKREKSTKDFFLGGQRVPAWAAGLSIMATGVSSIGFMAIPAKSFATDWAYFAGVATWFLVVPITTRVFIPFFHRLNVTSAYEYLEVRFNLPARLFASGIFCIMQILARMSAVLLLPALALSAVTGISTYTCIIAMGVLSTAYTVMGGMEAVIWTDVIQAIMLFGGALLCVVLVILGLDGGAGAIRRRGPRSREVQSAADRVGSRGRGVVGGPGGQCLQPFHGADLGPIHGSALSLNQGC